MVPFCDVAIQLVVRGLLVSGEEHCPEVGVLTSLIHNLNLLTSSFILLKILAIALCLIQVGLNVTVRDVSTLPNVQRPL